MEWNGMDDGMEWNEMERKYPVCIHQHALLHCDPWLTRQRLREMTTRRPENICDVVPPASLPTRRGGRSGNATHQFRFVAAPVPLGDGGADARNTGCRC